MNPVHLEKKLEMPFPVPISQRDIVESREHSERLELARFDHILDIKLQIVVHKR